MVARTRLTREAVIDAAIAIADMDGLEEVSLAAVASRVGRSTPSLYTHVESVADLLDGVTTRCTVEFAEVLRDAVLGRAGEDGFRSLTGAWRDYARRWPGRYAATVRPASRPTSVLLEAIDAGIRATSAVMRSLGVPDGELVSTGLTMRSYLQGFVEIEVHGQVADADAAFEHGVETLLRGFTREG